MNKYYTAQEVADRLKIKKATVYELIKRQELDSTKVGKQLRISEEQLEEYLGRSTPQDTEAITPAFQPESSMLKRDYLIHSNGLILSGQTSPALELLLSRLSLYPGSLPVLQTHMNTYNSLYSLYFGKVHIASASLSPQAICNLVPGTSLALICLYEYPIGLYVRQGNPLNISDISDLTRSDVLFANREKGSTRRIFLDTRMKDLQIRPDEISGYTQELVSDLSTAAFIAKGQADAAIGEQYAALHISGIDFVPLGTLPMYLVIHAEALKKPEFAPLLEIVRSEDFRTDLYNQTSYNTGHTGEIQII